MSIVFGRGRVMSVRGARFAGTAGLASSDGRLAKGGVALPAAREESSLSQVLKETR